MAKRFCDTELSDKEWFMHLSCRLKCAVRYLFDKCDNAGVWTPNYTLAAVYVGEPFLEIELLEIDGGNQFEKFGNKIFIPGFIEFQYGRLSENCMPHKPIIQKLIKYGLYERVLIGYQKGINTLKEKDKEQEKEKEEDLGKSENPLSERQAPEIETVERVFIQQGGTKEMALAFFNKYSAVGWVARGSPIKDFSFLVGTFITNWKEIKNGKGINSAVNKSKQPNFDKP